MSFYRRCLYHISAISLFRFSVLIIHYSIQSTVGTYRTCPRFTQPWAVDGCCCSCSWYHVLLHYETEDPPHTEHKVSHLIRRTVSTAAFYFFTSTALLVSPTTINLFTNPSLGGQGGKKGRERYFLLLLYELLYPAACCLGLCFPKLIPHNPQTHAHTASTCRTACVFEP